MQASICLEPEVTRLAAENITDGWADKLEKALASEPEATRNPGDWVRRNMVTNLVLIEMCGNCLYQAMLEPLIRLTQEIVLVVMSQR